MQCIESSLCCMAEVLRRSMQQARMFMFSLARTSSGTLTMCGADLMTS